jgi:hypothetical protein
MHIDASKAHQAMLRACIDLGRLEMKAKDFAASKAVLSEALAEATAKAGEDSQEAGGRGGPADGAGAGGGRGRGAAFLRPARQEAWRAARSTAGFHAAQAPAPPHPSPSHAPPPAPAASILAALATAHRQAGELGEASGLYQQLYALNDKANGSTNQSAVRRRSARVRPGLGGRPWGAC